MRRAVLFVALLAAACPGRALDPVPAPPAGAITDTDLAEVVGHFVTDAENERRPAERAAKLATLGMVYQANSFDALAEDCYRRALGAHPGVAQWWYHLAFVLERQDRYEEAVAAAGRAAAIVPDYPPIHRSLAFWALARGRLDEAETQARRAVELSEGGAGALIVLGRVQMELGRHEEAVETLAEAVAIWPADWGDRGYVHFLHGNALRLAGREEEARSELALGRGEPTPLYDPWREEIAGFRVGFEADLQRAHHLLRAGRIEEAIAQLGELRHRRPRHLQVLTDLGSAYLQAGRWSDAVAVLEECLAAHPGAVDPGLHLARGLWAAGRPDDALTQANRVVEANPFDADAREGRGLLLLRMDRAPEALADFDAASRLDPTNATVAALCGAAHLASDRGQAAAAAAAFERALAIDPSQTTAIAGLAILAVRSGNLAAADSLLASIAHRPDNSALLVADARGLRSKSK